jgi:hypothetical protein
MADNKDMIIQQLLERTEMLSGQVENLSKKVQPKNKNLMPAPDGGPQCEAPNAHLVRIPDTAVVELFAPGGKQVRRIIRMDDYDPEVHLLIESRQGNRLQTLETPTGAPTRSLAELAEEPKKPAKKSAPKKEEL